MSFYAIIACYLAGAISILAGAISMADTMLELTEGTSRRAFLSDLYIQGWAIGTGLIILTCF